MSYVLDASAVLAVLHKEPGESVVRPLLPDSSISIVNVAEIYSRLIDRGLEPAKAAGAVAALSLPVAPFDDSAALEVGRLRPLTRSLGLSLGDRCCLSLARHLGATAVTADRLWAQLSVCPVLVIR